MASASYDVLADVVRFFSFDMGAGSLSQRKAESDEFRGQAEKKFKQMRAKIQVRLR